MWAEWADVADNHPTVLMCLWRAFVPSRTRTQSLEGFGGRQGAACAQDRFQVGPAWTSGAAVQRSSGLVGGGSAAVPKPQFNPLSGVMALERAGYIQGQGRLQLRQGSQRVLCPVPPPPPPWIH